MPLSLGRAPGVVVVLAPEGAVAGVDVRGAPWGTRELDLLDPSALVRRVHGIVLADDSAVVTGVVRWLAERHCGFPVGSEPHEVVPIVPAAAVGGVTGDGAPRGGGGPDVGGPDVGYRACEAAGPLGPGALVVVGETVAALVVVDAELDKAACRRVAVSAHDGLARAGLHLPATVFALATGVPTDESLDELCAAAADAVRTSAPRLGARECGFSHTGTTSATT